MYSTVIFDLDGTLADTLEDLADAVNFALKNNGLKTYPVEDYRHFVGNGAQRLIKAVLGGRADDTVLSEKVQKDFANYYGSHSMDKTKSYPKIENMLVNLQNKGVGLAVLSNKPHAFVAEILQKLFPRVSFSAAWGKKEEFKIKPNPQALLALMQSIQANAKETLYVGDSDVDAKTAQNGNVDFIGVEWGFRGREELLSAGAKTTVVTAEELEKLVLNG